MTRLSDKIKAEISLRVLAERAGAVWDRHKSRPGKGDYWAPCPFHGEATSSFHLVEPAGVGGWFKCFGCDAKGSAVDFYIKLHGGSPRDAMKALADGHGIAREESPEVREAREKRLAAQVERQGQDAAREAARNLARARRIWRESIPASVPAADLLGRYLRARGIDLDGLGGVPATLRLHPSLPYALPGGGRAYGPAMVAAIGTAGDFRGVHRTWIAADGRARLPDGKKVPKLWLGETGAIYGSPVRFCAPTDCVIVGEGIETTLAVLAAMWRKGRRHWSAEAALSLGALAGPADPAGRGPGLTSSGEPLPSAVPDFSIDRNPGWMPPGLLAVGRLRRVLILGEGSARCPASAERHGRRALAKLFDTADRAKLIVPRRDWGASLDYADLAKAGEI